jgi:4-hydroxythreonine-4-phosphate dehydrogenase
VSRDKVIGVTIGCPTGVGPEVLGRALPLASPDARVLLFSTDDALARMQNASGVAARAYVNLVPLEPLTKRTYTLGAWGKPGEDDLALQRDALLAALDAATRGDIDAVVTGPVRKKALVVDGVQYPGQTELVAARTGGGEPLMIFSGGPFLLGLATVHVPLRDVSAHVTAQRLDRCLELLADAARRILQRPTPSIAVLGVNPHAGEDGLLGTDERDVVIPAVERARARGLDVKGPLPADGFFADVARAQASQGPLPDAVLAMHHDQGLAPYKLLAKGAGVNVTWGAGVVRTSPDHGTADALAGRNIAGAESMAAALSLADRLIR